MGCIWGGEVQNMFMCLATHPIINECSSLHWVLYIWREVYKIFPQGGEIKHFLIAFGEITIFHPCYVKLLACPFHLIINGIAFNSKARCVHWVIVVKHVATYVLYFIIKHSMWWDVFWQTCLQEKIVCICIYIMYFIFDILLCI